MDFEYIWFFLIILIDIYSHFWHAGLNIEFNWDEGRWKPDGRRVGEAKSKVALARRASRACSSSLLTQSYMQCSGGSSCSTSTGTVQVVRSNVPCICSSSTSK